MLDSSAKMTTGIANKLHLLQKRQIINQTRERKMFPTKNFHKILKSSLKMLKQEEDLTSLNEQRIATFNEETY